MQELVSAHEIIVRAQDSRKNYQPENISWYATSPGCDCDDTERHPSCRNLMGMMQCVAYAKPPT